MEHRRPRVLVTGFSVFPGAPVNPTEALVRHLQAGEGLDAHAAFRFEVFDVDYRALPARLSALGEDFQPDIALHFGLSGRAEGFRIETLARNAVCTTRPDQSGHTPADSTLSPGGGDIATSLPAEAIVARLREEGLTADLSDDAGDYLCNYLFYLACCGLHPGYAPAMAGFIHVPLVGPGEPLSVEQLVRGAELIAETGCDAWRRAHRL